MQKHAMTPKREKFAQAVASGLDQSASYRIAFDAERMKPSSVNVAASKLMADAKVRQRVEELRAPIAEKAKITLESHLRDLLALRDMAAEKDQMSAAITAEIARGKAAGVVAPEKREHTGAGGGAIQMAVDMSVMTDEQLRILATIRLANAGV